MATLRHGREERLRFSAPMNRLRALNAAPVAQLDRAPDYESGGRGFESCPVRQSFS